MTLQHRPSILAFDIFGTVVDWHGSIAGHMTEHYPDIDGDAFACAWREGYQPAMEQVRSGNRQWVRLDVLHRMILDSILPRFGLSHMDEAQRQALNQLWHRLNAWPDSAAALGRLKPHCMLTPLSNGHVALLTHLAKHNALPWDCVLSAEIFQAYKPDPKVYLGVADMFGVRPQDVMLVAAHHDDLAAARRCGLRTAYIERPLEWGAQRPKDVSPQVGNDLHCRDLMDLVQQILALDATPASERTSTTHASCPQSHHKTP